MTAWSAGWQRAVRHISTTTSRALAAITAAVVGIVLNLAVWFGLHVWFGEVREVEGFGMVNAVGDRVRREMFRNLGLEDLLSPRING